MKQPINSPDGTKALSANLSDIIIAALWLMFFLSLVFLVDVKHTRYKLIGMELSILALLGLWFWKDMDCLSNILKESVLLPVLSLLSVFTLFYVFSGNRPVAFSQWQRITFSCLAFLITYKIFPSKYRPFLINTLLIAGGLVSVYGILQHSGGIWRIQVPKMGRVYSTFGNPNFFASFLVGLIPLSIASFWKKKRLWKLVFILPMLVAIYFTATRGAWLGLIGTGFLLCVFWVRKRKLIIITIFLIGICIFALLTRKQWMRQTQRLLIWRDTLKMVVAKPAFGAGLGEFHSEFPAYASKDLLAILPQGKYIVNYTHNEFLEVLSETGITGFGIYIWLLIVFYYSAVRNGKNDLIRTGAMCGATGILIHSFISVNMRFAVSSIWAFMLMGIAVSDRGLTSNRGFPLDYKRVIPAVIFFALLSFAGRKVVEPLVSQKKLAKEVDFYDRPAEYDEKGLKEKIEKDPRRALTFYELGWEQAKRKDYENAIKNFKKAISMDGSKVGAYNNLGNIYHDMGRQDIAVKYYKEALKRNPNLADAHFNLAYIYYHQGRLKEATRELNIVLQLEPKNFKAKIMLEKMVQ